MPRKLRLSIQPKNLFRKLRAQRSGYTTTVSTSQCFPVSIALETVSVLKISIPREVYIETPAESLPVLQHRLVAHSILPQGWFDVTANIDDGPLLLSMIAADDNSEIPTVSRTLVVQQDFSWAVHVEGKQLNYHAPQLSTMPQLVVSIANIRDVITYLDSCTLCCGNEDDKYTALVEPRKGSFMNAAGTECVAYHDKKLNTIRCTNCGFLIPPGGGIRCLQCNTYRQTLNRMALRATQERNDDKCHPESHTNYCRLTPSEKDDRMHQLHQKNRLYKQKIERLKLKLEKAIEERGSVVDNELHGDLLATMREKSSDINKRYPQDSFQRMFWDAQLKAATLNNSKNIKWDPLIIRWCLYLRHLSSSAYEMLRESGVITLPSQRTLRDYTYYTKASTGFSADVDAQLMRAANPETCKEREKLVAILMDEMHIKEDLVYDKHTGAIIGFTNLGDVNFHLSAFENANKTDNDTSLPVANSMLVLLVRGLFSNLNFPYAQFPCTALSGDQMYEPLWEAVSRLELCGLKVLCLTCDGLAANRRLFRLHDPTCKTYIHKTANPYATDGRFLYFISDPPHLIKTVRNCWSNSKRRFWFDGKEILWSHLVDLYWKNRSQDSPGFALLSKLKFEHIKLTSHSKMRVDLAAQVLSNRVAKALTMLGGDKAEETAVFVSNFNKFFDCLNVTNTFTGKHKKDDFKKPYEKANDFRVEWLLEEFIPWLDKWEKSVAGREGFSSTEKEMMMLSSVTRCGIRITVSSFVEILEYIFKIPGVEFFLSNRLCQDLIEKFFSQQRQRGGANDNPNCHQFVKNTQAIRVINGTCGTIKGNCRGNGHDEKSLTKRKYSVQQENEPLPKRRYKH